MTTDIKCIFCESAYTAVVRLFPAVRTKHQGYHNRTDSSRGDGHGLRFYAGMAATPMSTRGWSCLSIAPAKAVRSPWRKSSLLRRRLRPRRSSGCTSCCSSWVNGHLSWGQYWCEGGRSPLQRFPQPGLKTVYSFHRSGPLVGRNNHRVVFLFLIEV